MVDLGRLFFLETDLPKIMDYDEASAAGTFQQLIEMENAAVFLLEVDGQVVGGIAGLVAPHYFNLDHLSGQELFWYVAPAHRKGREALLLIKTLEQWAIEIGASAFMLAAMGSSREAVGHYYRRKGYLELETYFARRLPCPH